MLYLVGTHSVEKVPVLVGRVFRPLSGRLRHALFETEEDDPDREESAPRNYDPDDGCLLEDSKSITKDTSDIIMEDDDRFCRRTLQSTGRPNNVANNICNGHASFLTAKLSETISLS